MRNVKSVCSMQGVILVIICASLGGCGVLPTNQQTPCVATQPVLKDTIETDSGFIVPRDEMGQITVYIEQLRQCADAN